MLDLLKQLLMDLICKFIQSEGGQRSLLVQTGYL